VNRESWRPLWSLFGLLVAYYAFPIGWGGPLTMAVGLIVTAAGLVLPGVVLAKELGQLRRGGEGTHSTRVLAMLFVLLVMSFSLAFFLLETISPGQIQELETRTDALYFSLSTMATVGYGDVHAEGQVARAMVCGLIVFNVVVVASLVREQVGRRGRPS
jgi:voltage-gated potassium channel